MNCISISYKNTPLLIREQFALSVEKMTNFVLEAKKRGVSGLVIVSTCNRFELYFTSEGNTFTTIEQLLCTFCGVSYKSTLKYFFEYSKKNAIRHLFFVTAGMDSMVVGEDEILRQVKEGYGEAVKNGWSDHELNIAFQAAMHSAKHIKTDTGISTIPVSIATLAANYALDFLHDHEKPCVFVIGMTGSVGSAVAKNIADKCPDAKIFGTSRKHSNGSGMHFENAPFGLVPYADRYEYLACADVIVSATKSPHHTLTLEEFELSIQKSTQPRKNRLFLDLSVPSDIDKEIASILGCQVVDIDYFEVLSKKNNERKQVMCSAAEKIMDQEIERTLKNIDLHHAQYSLDQVSEIVAQKGLTYLIYHLKEGLTSEELHHLLELIDTLQKEEM